MKKLVFLLAAVALSATTVTAQKYGHLNLGNLIALMPETKVADQELETFQKQLVAKGEEMAKLFQDKYAKFATDMQGGTLSPVQQQERQQELQKEQQAILQYEQEVRQQVQEKRQELLQPIFDKAEKVIAEVAKENGFNMIFDTSGFNTLLYAQDATDIMPMVLAKLGIKEPVAEK